MDQILPILSLGAYRFARSHRANFSICSGVWNQCSPFFTTVSRPAVFPRKALSIRREMRVSLSPYRIAVGTRHATGFAWTQFRYSQDRVSPNSVGISHRRSSYRRVTPAQSIMGWISPSMSVTGETNNARSSASSWRASMASHAPMLLARRQIWSQRAFRKS